MFISTNSRWLSRRKGQPVILTVVGKWCEGSLNKFEVIVYELQPEGSDEKIQIPRANMEELIRVKQLKEI